MSAYTVVFLHLFGVRIKYFREECHAVSSRPRLWISQSIPIVKRDITAYTRLRMTLWQLCPFTHKHLAVETSNENLLHFEYSSSFVELLQTTSNRRLTGIYKMRTERAYMCCDHGP